MNPLLLEILPLIKQGYCCSQLLIHLLLQGAGQENHQLIRAMHALCFGMGSSEGPCGLLSGGACVLGCFAGRGELDESAHPSLAPMVDEYLQWFLQKTQGQSLCHHVINFLQNSEEYNNADEQNEGLLIHEKSNKITQQAQIASSQHLCGQLLTQCWEKILDILENYEVEMDLKQ